LRRFLLLGAVPAANARAGGPPSRWHGVPTRAARARADLRGPGRRTPLDNSSGVCTCAGALRLVRKACGARANSRLKQVSRVRGVRVARYGRCAPSRSHAGPPARPSQAPCPYARWRPARTRLGSCTAVLHCPLRVLALRPTSPQAVRGVGPHKGVAPRRLLPAPQHGYESATQWSVSSHAYHLTREIV